MFRLRRPPSAPRQRLMHAIAMAACGVLFLISALGATHATHAATLTVCPTGPPDCDFADLQAAINAAAPGDEIIVAAGTYSGSVTLRGQLTIRGAADGPPVLTAAQGPVVWADDIGGTTLISLTVDGRNAISAGIELHDVNVSLRDVAVVNLRGRDGDAGNPVGDDVVAVRLAGSGRLVADGLTVSDIHAGAGYLEEDGQGPRHSGGDATGIALTGPYSLTLRHASFTTLQAGDAGLTSAGPYWCSDSGGSVWGIKGATADLLLEDVQFSDLTAGAPCYGLAANCHFHGGMFRGIALQGGSLVARDVSLTGLTALPSFSTTENVGIDLHNLDHVTLERVRVENAAGSAAKMTPAGVAAVSIHSPDTANSPFCTPPPLDVIGLSLAGTDNFYGRDLTIQSLHGTGAGGVARGVDINQAEQATLRLSRIDDIAGGFGTLTAEGLRASDVENLVLNGTQVRNVRGDDAPGWFYYAYFGDPGGSAAGITLQNVPTGTIAGNSIWHIVGGRGSDLSDCPGCPGEPGGDAVALHLDRATPRLAYNTIVKTVPGAGGLPAGEDGQSIGVRASGADASLGQTIVSDHAVGIHVVSGTLALDQIDYWLNAVDVVGVTTESRALHVDPVFLDAAAGDLHLQATSPLIDIADEHGDPRVMLPDMDGQPRPADGNGDGRAAPDLGADEFYADALVADLMLHPPGIAAGERVSVTLTLLNAGPDALVDVAATTTWEAGVSYVPDSLAATSGVVEFLEDGMGARARWTGDLPATATTTINVQLQAATSGDAPTSVNVTSHITTPSGAHDQDVTATLLINPRRVWLPIVMN